MQAHALRMLPSLLGPTVDQDICHRLATLSLIAAKSLESEDQLRTVAQEQAALVALLANSFGDPDQPFRWEPEIRTHDQKVKTDILFFRRETTVATEELKSPAVMEHHLASGARRGVTYKDADIEDEGLHSFLTKAVHQQYHTKLEKGKWTGNTAILGKVSSFSLCVLALSKGTPRSLPGKLPRRSHTWRTTSGRSIFIGQWSTEVLAI